MKVEVIPNSAARRGDEVKVGNVYTNAHGRPHYKIVIGIITREGRFRRPHNNVAVFKVFADGSCAGAACEPEAYLRDHQDLVGTIKEMPTLKVEWLRS